MLERGWSSRDMSPTILVVASHWSYSNDTSSSAASRIIRYLTFERSMPRLGIAYSIVGMQGDTAPIVSQTFSSPVCYKLSHPPKIQSPLYGPRAVTQPSFG